jgi:MYXO-CTERM domain-containing protein
MTARAADRPAARLRAALRRFARVLAVDPISRGRLRDTAWPIGLAPVVALSTGAFALAVLVILVAPVVRELAPLSVSVGATVLSLPRLLLPLLLWLVVVAVALLQTAALHLRRLTAVVLTATTSLIVLFLGSLDLGASSEEGPAVTPGKVVAAVAVAALVTLALVRRRARFAWWEFPLVLAIIGAATTVALARSSAASAPYGIDFGPPAVSLVMSSLGQLAVPAAIAAGAAVAELAVTASTALVAAVSRPARSRPADRAAPAVLVVAFVVIALWRLVEIAAGAVAGLGAPVDPAAWPLSVALVVAIGMLGASIHRVRGPGRTAVGDVLDRLDDVVLPVAIALSITLAPVVLVLLAAQVAVAWGLDSGLLGSALAMAETLRGTAALTIVRGLVGAALVVGAVLLARRGRRGSPELLGAIGAVALASVMPALGGAVGAGVELWSSEALAVVIALGTLLLAGLLAVRRQLDERRLALLTVALLLSAAAAWREVIADPLGLLLGASGIALVLVGFIWGFLTDAEITHSDSPAYPRPSRVLLFLANAVFGVTVLAFGALARDIAAAIDLDAFARSGDELIGTALILAAVGAAWGSALDHSARSRPHASTV